MKKIINKLLISSVFVVPSLFASASSAVAAPLAEADWAPVVNAIADATTNVTTGALFLMAFVSVVYGIKTVIGLFKAGK